MKSYYPNSKIKTDDQIIKAIKKLDSSKERTEEMWKQRQELIKILKTPYWLR